MASDIKLDGNSVILDGDVSATGNITLGGNGQTGNLQLRSSTGANTIFLGGQDGTILVGSAIRLEGNSNRVVTKDLQLRSSTGANTIFLDGEKGNVGIGTNNPIRRLHVEGSEIHTGGAGSGFSFSDRKKGDGERWVWYAEDGMAHLWSQKAGRPLVDIEFGADGSGHLKCGRIFTGTGLHTNFIYGEAITGLPGLETHINVVAKHLTLTNPKTPTPDINVLNRALTHTEDDQLVINFLGGYKKGVKIEGNVQTTGALAQASSIALKENVAELSGQEAMTALQGLNAVKYNYKADSQKEQHIGFIAEEVPDLVANSERDRLSPMDIVAVLTKAVQELAAEVSTLKQQHGG